ncbi:MAG: hypothetical protein PWQ96_350 [Clostridia bacterium]|jgi:hypothetical protein|nr:hypothetical protein [Clostridiales bacterium]MDK2984708.1 hypothetical protein [Clostridia bacterium]
MTVLSNASNVDTGEQLSLECCYQTPAKITLKKEVI